MGKKKFLDSINPNMRDQYRFYIKNQFEELRKFVEAREDMGTRRAAPSASRFESVLGPNANADQPAIVEEESFLVDWEDQSELKSQLEFNGRPTDTKIWVTQEDLWVYKTLLSIIANTNKRNGSTRPDNTAIRSIVQLQVGSKATAGGQVSETIYIPSVPGGGGPLGEIESPSKAVVEFGQEGQSPEESDYAILEGRYLDADGEPYPGDSNDFGTEYRKLPIRMVLLMEQRMIPLVLVECANATLPIEVTQLTVNRTQSNTVGFSGSLRSRRPPRTNRNRNIVDIRNLSEVEIKGVVLIYQPPDEAILPVENNDVAAT